MEILAGKKIFRKCWNISFCFSKWKIGAFTFVWDIANVFFYKLLWFYRNCFSLLLFLVLPFSFIVCALPCLFFSFPSLSFYPLPSLLSPLFSLFSPLFSFLSSLLFSFCRFLTTGLCSVFHSDLKRCAEELVQSFAKHFPQPLDFLLKSPSQVLTELSPSCKISEDHILQWWFQAWNKCTDM